MEKPVAMSEMDEERCLFGMFLKNPNLDIPPEAFQSPIIKLDIEDYLRVGKKLDALTAVRGAGHFSAYLLAAENFSSFSPSALLESISARSRKQAVIDAVEYAVDAVRGAKEENLEAAILEAIAELGKISVKKKKQNSILDDIKALSRELGDIEKGVIPPVFQTGLSDFDENVKIRPSNLVILAARPSMGKSALAVQWVLNMAKAGKRCMFVSIEMSTRELLLRMIASETGIDMARIEEWMRLTPSEISSVFAAMDAIGKLPVAIKDRPGASVSDVRLDAKHFNPDVIFIDHLHIMSIPSNVSKNHGYGDVTRDLKALAREAGSAVIMLAQLNRGVESREDKRPYMSDLRDSGSIEQDADIITLLYRDDYYSRGDDDSGISTVELITTKQRQGATGTVKVSFHRSKCQFFGETHGVHPHQRARFSK